MLLLPPKYEIIMVPPNHSFFKYCDSNFGLLSIAPCKVITILLQIQMVILYQKLVVNI